MQDWFVCSSSEKVLIVEGKSGEVDYFRLSSDLSDTVTRKS